MFPRMAPTLIITARVSKRHGLAIHLLNQNVPIPIISDRLGHSSVLTTMRYYLVITPEMQRQFVAGKV